ncbi:MAG: chemotaxis protein CheW [Cyanobacteriota bacterium]|nr:chemotaxis protein CheW [Cyanobacteriota bacterium]
MESALATPATGTRFLRFSVGLAEQALLSVDHIQDVFPLVIGEILPMPEVATAVMGLYNRRGSILWLVDLGYLLGSPPVATHSATTSGSLMTITLDVDQQGLGLVVPQVQDIEWQDPQAIQSELRGVFTPEVAQFLQGYLVDADASILMVLDPLALLQSNQWQSI